MGTTTRFSFFTLLFISLLSAVFSAAYLDPIVQCSPKENICATRAYTTPSPACFGDPNNCTLTYLGGYSVTYYYTTGLPNGTDTTNFPPQFGMTTTVSWEDGECTIEIDGNSCRSCEICSEEEKTFSFYCKNVDGGDKDYCRPIEPIFLAMKPEMYVPTNTRPGEYPEVPSSAPKYQKTMKPTASPVPSKGGPPPDMGIPSKGDSTPGTPTTIPKVSPPSPAISDPKGDAANVDTLAPSVSPAPTISPPPSSTMATEESSASSLAPSPTPAEDSIGNAASVVTLAPADGSDEASATEPTNDAGASTPASPAAVAGNTTTAVAGNATTAAAGDTATATAVAGDTAKAAAGDTATAAAETTTAAAAGDTTAAAAAAPSSSTGNKFRAAGLLYSSITAFILLMT